MSLLSFLSGRTTNEVFGPYGGISTTLVLPESFDKTKDTCPLVILMHGFMAKKEMYPVPAIASALAKAGIASIRFDFDAHGKSEGKFIDMTISSEIADARAVLEYARKLPFVSEIALLGHSQGGVVAGMLAGEMEDLSGRPKCVVLLAPAAVLKDDAIAGRCMHARYDASNPPEYVNVFFHKLGRRFILEAQKLPVYETSARYSGKVCIIQGKNDKIVPVSYAERYHQSFADSELHLLDNEGHFLNGDKARLMGMIVNFLKDNLA
ncbi:MAG: alpha/beta hydrolase [Bacteroidales bacterium]|nr:alpha/beta hydrolase [Bacteroidales bacterium]